jgi:hypothetical protein
MLRGFIKYYDQLILPISRSAGKVILYYLKLISRRQFFEPASIYHLAIPDENEGIFNHYEGLKLHTYQQTISF